MAAARPMPECRNATATMRANVRPQPVFPADPWRPGEAATMLILFGRFCI
jgi:hypothetical protein